MYAGRHKIIKIKTVAAFIAVCMILNLLPTFVVGDLFKRASASEPDFETENMQVYELAEQGLQYTLDLIASFSDEDEPGTGRIILDRDVSENISVPDNCCAVIDLNGYTLSPVQSESTKSCVTVYGMLKLKNSSPDSGGMISDGAADIRAADVVNGGRLILDGVTVDSFSSTRNGGGILAEEHSQVELINSTIKNCHSDLQGGGLYAYQGDCVEISDSSFIGNTAKNGGGIYYYRTCDNGKSASYTYQGLVLKSNTAEKLGGGLFIQYPLTLRLKASTVDDNKAESGGGMYFRSETNLSLTEGCSVSGNEALSSHGGGIFFFMTTDYNGSQIELYDSSVNNNTSASYGGGIYFHTAHAKVRNRITIDSSELNNNVSGDRGGAVYAYSKTDIAFLRSRIIGNSAKYYGGGIFLDGGQSGDNRSTFLMTGSVLSENTLTSDTHTHSGGGMYIGSNTVVNLESGEISKNTNAINGGGAYFNTGCEVNLREGMVITQNSTMYHTYGWKGGNGIFFNSCKLNMTGGVFSQNNCSELLSRGGGFYFSGGTAVITGGSVIGNETSQEGAGVYFSGATVDISGSFYAANNISKSNGGAIYFYGCTVDIGGDFIAENNTASGSGGAIYCENTSIDIRENVIIRSNRANGSGGGIFGYGENLNFHMMGGSVTENSAGSNGGGIYFQNRKNLEKRIRLTGGEVTNNTAQNGGGVFIGRIGGGYKLDDDHNPEYPGESVEISTAMRITGNTASSNGGGVYVGDCTRMELYAGGVITDNTANSGGGVFVSGNGYYFRQYANAKDRTDNEEEALEIYGGELHDNISRASGRDIYVSESTNLRYYVPPYIRVARAASMDGSTESAYWLDENTSSYMTAELSNKSKVDNNESPKYSLYTFCPSVDAVASIGDTVYPSVQAAIDAVASGEASDNNILMLKSHRETVTVDEGVEACLDMNGFSLYGEKTSVIKVNSGGKLSIIDGTGNSVIAQGRGTNFNNGSWGGGVITWGELYIEGVTLTGNYAQNGTAAAAVAGGRLEMKDCTVSGNTFSDNCSMIRADSSTLVLDGIEITGSPSRSIQLTGSTNAQITNTSVRNSRGNNASALVVEGAVTAHIEGCSFTDNAILNGMGTIYLNNSNSKVYVKDTLIKGNSSTFAAGIDDRNGAIHLDNVTVTENVSSGEAGGVYLQGGNSRLYMKNSRIYNNNAASFGDDMKVSGGSYFMLEAEEQTEYRAVESFGVDGYEVWQDDQTGVFYVADKTGWDSSSGEYCNILGELVRENNSSVLGTHYLTATKAPDVSDPVAEFKDTGRQFYTLALAFRAAVLRGEDTEIRLLKDVTENIIVTHTEELITLDFNGHSVRSNEGASQVFYIQCANVTFMDTAGGGSILPPENTESRQPRGIYHSGGRLTIEDITVSGFNYIGNGAALCTAAGASYNNTYYPSELYIRSGTISGNTATGAGGGIYFSTAANSHSVFEMTGGTVSNNTATGNGGGIHLNCTALNDYTTINITGGLFIGNTSLKSNGGGIYFSANANINDNDSFCLYGCTIKDNTAVNYGGICADRAGNRLYGCVFGNENVKTVLDGNHSTNTYAAGYVGSGTAGTMRMTAQNIEIKNHTTGSTDPSLYLHSQKLLVRNIDFHDNYSIRSNAFLRVSGGELIVEDSEFHDNTAREGGAGLLINNTEQAIRDGTKIVRNCRIYNNSASGSAGLNDSNLCDITFEDCEVYNNFARDNGIWVFSSSGLAREKTLVNCYIHDNISLGYGGAISTSSLGSCTIRIKDTVIENNYAASRGGAIYTENSGNTFIIDDGAELRNNICKGSGGAVHIYYSNMLITGGRISYNHSYSTGGGIYWYGSSATTYFTMTGGSIDNNLSESSAGGIYLFGCQGIASEEQLKITFSGGEIKDNTAKGSGGGIYLQGNNNWNYYNYGQPQIRITGTKITGNYAMGSGGGIFNGDVTKDVIISDDALVTKNVAGSQGGGLYVAGRDTYVQLTDKGKLYGNQAALGNDVYIPYNSSYRNSNLYLQKASDMFDESDGYVGIGWLNENKGTVHTDVIRIRPLGQDYPFTLNFRAANRIVAVYNGTEYTTVQEAVEAAALSGTHGVIDMVDDSVESVTIGAGVNVTINLNGHTLEGGGTSAITNRGQLEIVDTKKTVTAGGNTYEMSDKDGRITGHAAVNGGGIYVISGKVVMRSGIISDCMAGANKDSNSYGGGAVCIAGGEFEMYGGSLSDNVARYGSAVLVRNPSGRFTMYGGTISGNRTSATTDPKTVGYGAIFNVNGEVNIFGGTITDNTAYAGGGIYNSGGRLNIIGQSVESKPVISNNIGGYSGGGIYCNSGSIKIACAEIRDNRTTYEKHNSVYNFSYLHQGAGGGIFVYDASVIIEDNTLITGNYAVRGGAIYQFRNTVQIGGEHTVITENTAELGGGCAQNPLTGVRTTLMTLVDGASVYGNRSITTAAGNDFYSAWEGTNTYNQQLGNAAQNTPAITLIAASKMAVGDRYNVWKNDNYTGDSRIGEDLVSGQYVISEVNVGNNLQITASYFDTEVHTLVDSDFKITHVVIEEMIDGLKRFDNGTTDSGVVLDNSAPFEKTASELLDTPGSGAHYSDLTYQFNEQTFRYIEYNGRLYEQHEAVEWQAGNDSGGKNHIIRSFDTITYSLHYTFEGDPKLESYTRDYNCEIKIRVIVKGDRNEVVINGTKLSNVSISPSFNEYGEPVQIMTGCMKSVMTPEDIASGSKDMAITVEVKGMKNGSIVKPSFELWFNGNNTSPHAFCEAERATVSAAPKYNVTVMNNPSLLHTGYFDIENKAEVGESDAEKENVVFGTVLGFGATVELYNDPASKGLTGIELPADGIEFDLSFAGKLYNSYLQEIEDGTDAPIVWAYKENNSSIYGRDLNSNLDTVNMSWDDEDWKTKNSHYAYGAAPYNTGGDDMSCYDGGGWIITKSQADSDTETKLHVRIDGYKFNGDTLPNKLAGNVSSTLLASGSVKAFTAGYIQLILPLDPHDDEHGNYGYYQIYMDAVASGFSAVSVTGQRPEEIVSASNLNTPEKVKADLDGMNEYYHYADSSTLRSSGLAVNERRYYDNYTNVAQSLVLSPDGTGTSIGKYNMFNNYKNQNINGSKYNDNGRGDTPLNSTVYIQGTLYFNSEAMNTADANSPYYALNDPRYNATAFNVIEYNYMTGYNILQKFDAEAYTIKGAPPVVSVQNGKQLNDLLGDSFIISNTETEIAWSKVTTQYKLTILYGAKPDGSNWVKKKKTDTTVSPNIEYDDGGAADMDKYREENLLYFLSLDDLHEYLGEDAKCVAVLYQFRDTVIRSGNSVTCCAKADVTGEFMLVGDTYCTTNDVRAWYTYRPYYKLDYYDGVNYENSYNFNWVSMQLNPEQQTTDRTRDDFVPPVYGAALPPQVFMNIAEGYEEEGDYIMTPEERALAEQVYHDYTQQGRFPIQLSAYTSNYIKSRYRNGVKVGGTHNGMDKGNSLLLYSVDTSVDLNVATKIKHSNTVKMEYDITAGERDVRYRVTPHVTFASGANKTALIRNGTQSADIELILDLPKDLHYINGSVSVDYTYSDYSEGEMNWEVYEEETENGVRIHLKTFVSDIDKTLPEIFFDCFIGDVQDPQNDIRQTGTPLTVTAHIGAEYSEFNLLAAESHNDSKTINVLLTASEGIVKSVENKLVELGDDLVYTLTYSNTNEGPTYNIEMTDVLPHNSDTRGTLFTGGYRVESLTINFTTQNDFEGFIEENGLLQLTQDSFRYEAVYDNNIDRLNGLMSSVAAADKVALSDESIIVDEDSRTISYSFAGADTTVNAFNAEDSPVKAAPAVYALIPFISGNSRAHIRITLSPKESENGSLISSGGEGTGSHTQTGGCEYYNSYSFRRIKNTQTNEYSIPLVSNLVSVSTVRRELSGVVWLDQDRDGMYNTPEAVQYNNSLSFADPKAVEYPVSGIDVRLMKIEDNGTMSRARNVLGQLIPSVKTDQNGRYSFTELAAGNYMVVFDNEDDDYVFRSQLENDSPHPLPFYRLSVTTDENLQADRGNKCAAVYDNNDASLMRECRLINSIVLPEKDNIPTVNYSSPNWNLGLYYYDLTVSKTWSNMIYGINENSTIEISVTGNELATNDRVYEGLLRMTNSDGEVKAYYIENGRENEAVEKTLVLTESPDEHIYKWAVAPDDRIYLQAENAHGVIDYSLKEVTIKANGQDIGRYYNVYENDNTDPITQKRSFEVNNNQILGSVTILKYSSSREALSGAEFSIYQVDTPKDENDTAFYGSKHGVGDTLTESYRTLSTKLYTKVYIGSEMNLLRLGELEMYDSRTKELTVESSGRVYIYKIHTEQGDEGPRYYYYTENNVSFSYELIIGGVEQYEEMCESGVIDVNDKYHQDGFLYSVLRRRVNGEREYYVVITVNPASFKKVAMVEFRYLPLYDTQGRAIYYTVRETKEPDGYASLADFNMLTGMNLFDGLKNSSDEYVRDLCFEVENIKTMKLPVSGGAGLTTIVIIGTMIICLGSFCLFLLYTAKKRKRRAERL